MTYFGLPYIHAVFDVAAWLASMTVFWLTTRHLLPADALPANRVPHPGAYAVTAGAGALVRRHVLRHGECASLRRARAGLFHGRRHRRRHRRDRGLQAPHRRRAARPASSSPRPSPPPSPSAAGAASSPASPTSPTARRPACRGASISATASSPSGAALRIARDGGDVRRADPALPGARPLLARNGFYLTVGWYALQRFVWEFFKPYATVLGPVQPLPCGLPGPGPVRCRDDPQRGPGACTTA